MSEVKQTGSPGKHASPAEMSQGLMGRRLRAPRKHHEVVFQNGGVRGGDVSWKDLRFCRCL